MLCRATVVDVVYFSKLQHAPPEIMALLAQFRESQITLYKLIIKFQMRLATVLSKQNALGKLKQYFADVMKWDNWREQLLAIEKQESAGEKDRLILGQEKISSQLQDLTCRLEQIGGAQIIEKMDTNHHEQIEWRRDDKKDTIMSTLRQAIDYEQEKDRNGLLFPGKIIQ